MKALKLWAKRVGIAQAVLTVLILMIAGEAVWRFNSKHVSEPYEYGVSFVPQYAEHLGLDPEETFEAILTELKPDRVRLTGYWNQVEAKRDQFSFERLDWQMEMAAKYQAKVSLAIGLRQPRYPECHYPDWSKQLGEQEIYDELIPFITAVVERYRNHPALDSYQLENEALLTVFGECMKFSREQLVKEFELVKNLDPNHPVAVSVSNEYGFPIGEPTGDLTGFSVYRRVYDARVLKRFVNYPFPRLWFRVRAAIIERFIGGEVFIHEQQAEPWGKKGTRDLSIAEQDESFDVDRLKETADFARGTGIKRIDFWGAEWWYWRKVKFSDPSVWETAKTIFSNR